MGQLTAYQSNKQGLVGDLETLAVRMESAGMTKEVAESWAKMVRKAIERIEAVEWLDGYKTSIEGEVKEHTEVDEVIDTIQNDTAFEVDSQALRHDLENMESGETVRLRDDCAIYRY